MTVQAAAFWVISDRVLVPALNCAARVADASQAAALVEKPLAIRVDGGRILELSAAEEIRRLVDVPGAITAAVHDVGSDPIVPGWVNAHTHLAMSALRGIASRAACANNVVTDVFFRLEAALTPRDVFAFTCLGAYESLVLGGLYVFDHYYYGEQVARALVEVGLPGTVAPAVQDCSGPFMSSFEEALDATMAIHGEKTFQDAGVQAAFGPHAGDTVSADLFGRLGEMARNLRIPVHLHLAQSFEEVAELDRRYGTFDRGVVQIADALAESDVLVAHGLHLSQERVVDLASRGWVLAYCPLSQLQFGILGPVEQWLAAGGAVALGTDCVASNDALDVQRELPLVAGSPALSASLGDERRRHWAQGSVVTSRQVEESRRRLVQDGALKDPERLLVLGDGRAFDSFSAGAFARSPCSPFEVGALANFLVLDQGHPALFPAENLGRLLAYGSTHSAIKWGVVAGKRVGLNRGWQNEWLGSEHYREISAEASRRRAELLARARVG